MAYSKSSRRWLAEHHQDPFVRKARAEGWRSRAVFKLAEILRRDPLLRPGMRVIDLGAAPGSWSQYVAHILAGRGRVIALDRLPMDPIPGVDFVHGDFNDPEARSKVEALLDGELADLVLCDMAPNMMGVSNVDHLRALALAEEALEAALHWLKPGGHFVVKLFHGPGFDAFVRRLKTTFAKVAVRKPRASRSRSAETYAVAQNRRLVRAGRGLGTISSEEGGPSGEREP